MFKCPQCSTAMETKGEISEDAKLIFYQCPKCKNIELHAVPYNDDLRMTYP